MSGKFGIGNLMAIVSILALLGNTGGKAYEDGKIDMSDLSLAGDLAFKGFPLLAKVEWSQLVPEAGELAIEEQAQLLEHFKKEFNIPQDSLEFTIESVLEIARDGSSLVARLVALFKNKSLVVPA